MFSLVVQDLVLRPQLRQGQLSVTCSTCCGSHDNILVSVCYAMGHGSSSRGCRRPTSAPAVSFVLPSCCWCLPALAMVIGFHPNGRRWRCFSFSLLAIADCVYADIFSVAVRFQNLKMSSFGHVWCFWRFWFQNRLLSDYIDF